MRLRRSMRVLPHQYGTNFNQAIPSARVKRVTGIPTLQYSQNEISTPSRRAFSTTMRLATEPSTVRLPANVLDIASASHAVSWLVAGIAFITGSNNNTAGTLLTRFDSAADTRLSKSTG